MRTEPVPPAAFWPSLGSVRETPRGLALVSRVVREAIPECGQVPWGRQVNAGTGLAFVFLTRNSWFPKFASFRFPFSLRFLLHCPPPSHLPTKFYLPYDPRGHPGRPDALHGTEHGRHSGHATDSAGATVLVGLPF